MLSIFTAATIVVGVSAFAQAPGVVIERQGGSADSAIIEKASALREAGKLKLTIEATKKQLETPVPAAVALPAPNTHPLSGRDVASRARAAHVRLGWFYLCKNCSKWHINLAGAYAIATDAIATCHHCVEPKTGEMREGYLIGVDHRGEVFPVTAILAKSASMDAAILRVEGITLDPLPFNDNVAPGDPAFCYSAPLGQAGYFSEGIVNRFVYQGIPLRPPNDLKRLRVNVSTDWAPGSSGSAVLDQCGNAIGHVSTMTPLSEGGRRVQAPVPAPDEKKPDGKQADAKSPDQKPDEKKAEEKPAPPRPAPKADRFGGATLITLHEAVTARGMIALAKDLRDVKPGEAVAAAPQPAAKTDEEKSAEVVAKLLPEAVRALAGKKWDEAEKLIADLDKALPESRRPVADDLRFKAAIGRKNGGDALRLAQKIADRASITPEQLNNLAWELVTADGLENLDLAMTEQIARRGVEAAPEDRRAHIQDTLARVLFRAGKKDDAIKAQEAALNGAAEGLKDRFRATLDAYKKGELPPAS
jgi:Trypsin-like peptidase domain